MYYDCCRREAAHLHTHRLRSKECSAAVCVCASILLWQSHCGCPSVMLTEDINSLLPEADSPSFSTQCFCIHIRRTLMCVQVQHLSVCVCGREVSVCTPQSGVWVSVLVKVNQIGGVSGLLFNSSRNSSCQEY